MPEVRSNEILASCYGGSIIESEKLSYCGLVSTMANIMNRLNSGWVLTNDELSCLRRDIHVHFKLKYLITVSNIHHHSSTEIRKRVD